MTQLAPISDKLRKLLLMLSSDQPGEVTSAATAIGRTLHGIGADWHDLANRLLAPAEEAKAQPRHSNNNARYRNDGETDWRVMRDFCSQHPHLLNERELDFMDTLEQWRGTPTEKQFAWLQSIYARLRRCAA
jgi:hypothetical protein